VILLMLLAACATRPSLQGPPDTPLSFPEDHGVHREAQTEWWYAQSVVETDDGRTLALFLSTVRHDPRADKVAGLPLLASAGTGFITMATVADLDTGERLSERWTMGATSLPQHYMRDRDDWFHIRNRRWQTHGGGGQFTFVAPSRLGRLTLHAYPTVDPLPIGSMSGESESPATGRAGFPGAAFSYYTLPRAQMFGSFQRGKRRIDFAGDGWVDHQYGYIYSDLYRGWWWFALMLDDGSDLMVTVVEPLKDRTDIVTLGTLRRADGEAVVLGELEVRWGDTWTSRRTNASYPREVFIDAPEQGLSLTVTARRVESEWKVEPAPIWEGPVTVSGTRDGLPIEGKGFAEFLIDGDRLLRKVFRSGEGE
jgi:predicted secreted hydrolase